jgi:hypothetical protein
MQRPSLVVLVLVVLVAFAGCNGFFGGTDPTPRVTPAAVPTETPAPQLAPGLTSNGITNVTALFVAHNATLRNTSFTKYKTSIDLYTNGTVTNRGTAVMRVVGENNGYYRTDTLAPDSPNETSRIETWSNEERTLTKWTYANNTTRYTTTFWHDRTRAARPFALRLQVATNHFNITTENSTLTARFTRNGTHFYRVRSTDWSSETSYILQLLVDSRGIIHKYSIIARDNNRTAPDAISIITANHTQIGTTAPPDRPSWYPTARNATTPNATNQRSR